MQSANHKLLTYEYYRNRETTNALVLKDDFLTSAPEIMPN